MQNGTMPQFGMQNHNKPNSVQNGPADVFRSFSGGNPNSGGVPPENGAFGSAIKKEKKSNPLTNLKKEQILPALVAVFGFLTLIFLVSTIALAVGKSDSGSSTKQTAVTTPVKTADISALGFSLKKIEGYTDEDTYKFGPVIKSSDGHLVVASYVNTSGSGASFDVNWEFATSYYNLNATRVDQESFVLLTGETVVDAAIGRATNEKTDDVLLLLLANGKIQYMPIRESLEKYSFKVYGEIEDVEEIVKFYRAYEMVNGELTETILVQKTDGTIIDLRAQLLKIVGKDTK
ncbi:hypothetical protein IKF94_03035 [Candidatus Saccharibacteria bacterium]|nr:hypothetical protein [Candidatus Saccharibacteria bacterium]